MNWRHARAALRMDGAWWRRFAELGCVYGPEWWKRGSPPVIAAIIYAIAGERRRAVVRNQQQVQGAAGWVTDHWRAYRVFAEFARAVTEYMEQWGSRPRPVEWTPPSNAHLIREALAERRGLVVVTGHFGSWEVAARYLGHLGPPVNLVMAHEPNPSVREFVHRLHTRHGINVIHSHPSMFGALPVLHALRRNEIVGMQLDPWGPLRGTEEVEFFGRPMRFQLGPFAIARLARAPLVPVFTVRTAPRRYALHVVGRFAPASPEDTRAAFVAAVRGYEALVRQFPTQWLLFEDVWRAVPQTVETGYEIVPQASGLRRR